MVARLFVMAVSLWTCKTSCLQGGRLRMGVPMIFVSVALTPGRVLTSPLPTAPAVEQPCAIIPLTEVTPSLRFNRKIYKKIRNPDPTKLKLKSGRKFNDGSPWLEQDEQNFELGARATLNICDVLLRKRA